MPSVQEAYGKYYAAGHARRGLFEVLAKWAPFRRILYPGSFIHLTPSFVFPSVVYVDNNRDAKKFFSKMDDVLAFVKRNKNYRQNPELAFHGRSYETPINEPEDHFDHLLPLYADFISKPRKGYLKAGGILAANNSRGDAGLASIDPDYEFIAVVQGRGDNLRITEGGLDAYFKPKKATQVTEELLRRLNRGIGYTKTAPVYLFRRLSQNRRVETNPADYTG